MNSQIKFLKSGLIHSMAHAVAHGMLADYNNFDRFYYLDLCRQLFVTFEIDAKMISQMIKLANKKGVIEYNMIKLYGGTLSQAIKEAAVGAQMHPAETPIVGEAEKLSELLYEVV